jgi:hypothetical protein
MGKWLEKRHKEIHQWTFDAYRRNQSVGGELLLQAIEIEVNGGLEVMKSAWGLAPEDRLFFYWCTKLNKHVHVFDEEVLDVGNFKECVYCKKQEMRKGVLRNDNNGISS